MVTFELCPLLGSVHICMVALVCLIFYHSFLKVVVVVQLLSHVWLFVTPWTVIHQAWLSFTISLSLLRLINLGFTFLWRGLKMSHSVLSLHVDESSGTILSDNASVTLGWGKLRYRGSLPTWQQGPSPTASAPQGLPQRYLQPEQHIPLHMSSGGSWFCQNNLAICLTFIYLLFITKIKHSSFKMLCWFQVYDKMVQLYLNIFL